MQRTGTYGEIVDETPASGEQRALLDALNRLAAPACHYSGHPRNFLTATPAQISKKSETAPLIGAPFRACYCIRSLSNVDVLSVDHLQDRRDAGAVTHLVHGDRTGNAREILEGAEALADLVAVALEILRLVGDARLLEAIFERVDDIVGAGTAVGRQLAVELGPDFLYVGLDLRAGIVEPSGS